MPRSPFNRPPPPLDRRPAVTPPKPTSWLAEKDVQDDREAFDAAIAREAQRMNAVSTTQHVQRKEGDA